MKRIVKVALALAFGLGLTHVAQAAVTDQLTVTITPNAYYSVVITTDEVNLDLGAVDMGVSTQTVQPSTVTIFSTFATTDLRLQGAIGPTWSFDDLTTSSESNKLASWATFTSIARSSAPVQGATYFVGTSTAGNGTDVISTSNLYVGDSATTGNDRYEGGSGFDVVNMDAMAPYPAASSRSHLWLYFRTPGQTTTTSAQNIVITLTSGLPD